MGNLGKHLIWALAATALLTTACGNEPGQRMARSTRLALKSSPAGSGSAATSGSGQESGLRATYSCPNRKNIVPSHDWNLDGTGYYEACASAKNMLKVALFAPYPNRPRVCVFPAEEVAPGKVFAKPGSDALPIYRCGQTDEMGVELEFSNMNFNGLFVVAEDDRLQMQNCLTTGDGYTCPKNWSYGKFR